MPSTCRILAGLLLVSAATCASAQAEPGWLRASAADVVLPRWQARMLAGETVTNAARDAARALLAG